MSLPPRFASCLVFVALLLPGCATRSRDVVPAAADRTEFVSWSCARIQDEIDNVQQRAADVAYDVDERAGNNIMALGVGVAIFWPALLAMRADGFDAEQLARLKGRYEALRDAERLGHCEPVSPQLPPDRVAAMPVAAGERLVYEERSGVHGLLREHALRVLSLQRDEIEYTGAPGPGSALASWKQDLAGNLWSTPDGALQWQRVLKRGLVLGQVLAGEFLLAGEPLLRARVRGQVVAVGPQSVAGRSFDAAVVELFGDAMGADGSTRLDGVIVVDRRSGVLLRLDLRSGMAPFSLQRRLSRVEPAP